MKNVKTQLASGFPTRAAARFLGVALVALALTMPAQAQCLNFGAATNFAARANETAA